MHTGIVVQARMSSSRLPGKVLRDLCGHPLLEWLLEGLAQSAGAQGIVVATSSAPSDDPVEEFCTGKGTPCYRGPLENVAARMLGAAKEYGMDNLVRVCGDSPFLDPALVDQAIVLFRQGGADLVTNVARRTYPKGQSVEVVSREALARAVDAMTSPEEREHVTKYCYAHPEQFCIRSMESGGHFGAENFCVDTVEDLQSMTLLANRLCFGSARPGWHELMALKAGA